MTKKDILLNLIVIVFALNALFFTMIYFLVFIGANSYAFWLIVEEKLPITPDYINFMIKESIAGVLIFLLLFLEAWSFWDSVKILRRKLFKFRQYNVIKEPTMHNFTKKLKNQF